MSRASRDLPPLEWIRVFETAARHLNFSAAAAERDYGIADAEALLNAAASEEAA